MSDDADGRSLGGVESLQLERAQGGDLSQEDTRQGDRCGGQCRFRRAECGCVVGILGKILLEHPADRIEADGTNDEKFVGDGGQDGGGFVDEVGQFRLERGIAGELFEGAEPRCTLASEGECVRFTGCEAVCERTRTATAPGGPARALSV